MATHPSTVEEHVGDGDFPLPRFTLATEVAVASTRPGPLLTVKKRRKSVSKLPRSAAVMLANGLVEPSGSSTVPHTPNLSSSILTDHDFPEHTPPSDTQVALMTLRGQWPGEAFDELARLPPVVLLSQLYALVADRAAVDRDVDAMRASNIVRYVKLSASSLADYALVLTDDLRPVAARSKALTDAFVTSLFDHLLPVCTEVSITQDDINRVFGSDVDAATLLIRCGFLTLKDEVSFWFSIPYAGYFVKVRERGNKELLGILRRAPYMEMLLVKLELRRLRSSLFPAIFHIRDVIGSNTAETVNTTLGTLVRLRAGLENPFPF